MELSSPVASLVPSLVFNAVVTFEGWLFGSRRSRLGECPFCATRAAVTGSGEDVARKRNRDRKTTNAALPVMRPDAAGIDIGATEIFVAVRWIVRLRMYAHLRRSGKTSTPWPIG